MELVPRKLKENDLKKLLELYRHLHPDDPEISKEALGKSWTQIMGHESFLRYIVLENKNALVASCCVSVIPNLTRSGRPYALIENVITHPDYRRKGAGAQVIKAAIEYAAERNCYKIMLLSDFARKEAHAFYKSLGFNDNSKKGFLLKLS